MAVNRLSLVCRTCSAASPHPSALIARLPVDGDWTDVGEPTVAQFINVHRWHHPSGAGVDHLHIEWECDEALTSTSSVFDADG